MAPRILSPAQGNAAARTRAHFTTKPEATVHTSRMFKNNAQHTTTSRSKAAPLTKYDLTSKPHGITKSKPQGRGSARRVRKPEHALSTLFDDASFKRMQVRRDIGFNCLQTSNSYRSTLINTAQDSLFAARRALVYRLTSTNGPGEQKQPPTTTADPSGPFSFSPTASDRGALSPPNRLPTAAELQAAHNAVVAKVTAPFGETSVVRGGSSGVKGGGKLDAEKNADALAQPHQEQPLSEIMADFAAVVAREEKNLRELGGQWMQTRAEIRLLAEDIFGKEAVRDMMKGKNKVGDEVAEVGRGLGEEEVEALKRVVEELVEEAEAEAEQVREAEMKVKREQKKMILATVKKIEEL